MARDKRFFKVFAKINPKTGTPVNAQIATMIVSSLLILFGTFEQLTALVAFCALDLLYTGCIVRICVQKEIS